MVRVFADDGDPTGPVADESSEPVEKAVERGRKRAVAIVMEADDEPERAADGGLHADTIRWLAQHPEADNDAVLAYDRNTRPYRRDGNTADVPPRGESLSEQNVDRNAIVNVTRTAIRQYYELEERTG